MSWAEQWYRSLAEHNTGICQKATCRHCLREKETKERQDKAIAKAKVLCADLNSMEIAKAVASYNGGSDESFVDYFYYYNKDNVEVKSVYVCDTDEEISTWHQWSKAMEEIAWGILGSGFGNGDYSVVGNIILNASEGKLYNNSELIASLRE